MHSGFSNLRSALPMNLKAKHQGFKLWQGAKGDIDRVTEIWRDCLAQYGGPYLFGAGLTLADAMYAPVVSRFNTYKIQLPFESAQYAKRVLEDLHMQAWYAAAANEKQVLEQSEVPDAETV